MGERIVESLQEENRGKKEKGSQGCKQCCISMEESIHLRRCFMTGEYCSKQISIHHEKKKKYDKKSITAFVIMNFSDMADVVYKWRVKPFIESIAKYLYFNEAEGKLYCREKEIDDDEGLDKVEEIRVVRSDSNPASNYVICSRICQQMQIADLIIVDVSIENANVFYEFGMAVSLGKLILPICFSESFYEMDMRKKVLKTDKGASMEHFIGCYPWRKKLFEYYGIRYKRDNGTNGKKNSKEEPDNVTEYFELKDITDAFSDTKYNCFPYHEKLPGSGNVTVGEQIYNSLKNAYNSAGADDNTLVVYTIEGFLNEDQAGLCIVNFYRDITERMRAEYCFCGDRVGVLVQEKVIPDEKKDAQEKINPDERQYAREHSDVCYNVGEIIHIGMNQATYLAAEEKLKTEDALDEPRLLKEQEKAEELDRAVKRQKEEMRRFVKGHIRNRGMLIYPNNPVYVTRMKNGLQSDLLSVAETSDKGNTKTFCLYHVMLKNLRFTNEIVVDITDNCLQSLFWLGAAHGSDIYAITVVHEKTNKE